MSPLSDELKDKARSVRADFERAINEVRESDGLKTVRDQFLGRKAGAVTTLLKSLGGLAEQARKDAGRELNELRNDLEARLGEVQAQIEDRARADRLRRERVDATLPGRPPAVGRRHPLMAMREELEDIFLAMGYEVYDGPEIEDDYHCFEALNMPPDHPARDMQDTFYLSGRQNLLLRTHTSSAQIRYMLANAHPPLVRIVCLGKVYRRDSDVTHSPMFQQIEGLVVGPRITLGDLKGTIETFLHAFFGPQYPVRFRPSFFPYTEPSVEVDLGCIVCGGSGCRVCKGTGWVEIMGSGMVHPAVFEAVNARLGRAAYDPDQITGFAFGLGIERLTMMRYGIDDIRLFYESDLRFLEQF
ncbi:MAG: phenylalanine--tRNA ligase subunit alpha [Vicinamibacteria bacterium]|jgi:phenylalanyl-tRNA synthetase alpha chain|nr:phenylalanine--tRNA ligase subunit alpha [Vicinamibacteria bacterium]